MNIYLIFAMVNGLLIIKVSTSILSLIKMNPLFFKNQKSVSFNRRSLIHVAILFLGFISLLITLAFSFDVSAGSPPKWANVANAIFLNVTFVLIVLHLFNCISLIVYYCKNKLSKK